MKNIKQFCARYQANYLELVGRYGMPKRSAGGSIPFITVGWVAPLVCVDEDWISSFGVALTARRIHMAWARYSVIYCGSWSVMVGWVAPLVCVADGHVPSH